MPCVIERQLLHWFLFPAVQAGFDPVMYYLYCQSLELYLKSFIWFIDRSSSETIRDKYRHNIEKLWRDAKKRDIGKYIRITQLRDNVIALVGPYYKTRKFNYLDLDMVHRGYKDLRSEPRVIPTLRRLTGQMENTLLVPILKAS